MVGFGCKFFRLKELIKTSDKTMSTSRRLLGISPQRIVLLDEGRKELIQKWHLTDLKKWEPDEDNKLKFIFCGTEITFLMEKKGTFRDITTVILNCTKARKWMGWTEADFKPWSKLAEEKEMWGKAALAANFPKGDPHPSTGLNARGRSVTFASNVATSSKKKEKSFFGISFKLSTSAPVQGEQSLTTETSSLIVSSEKNISTPPIQEQPFDEAPFSAVLTPDPVTALSLSITKDPDAPLEEAEAGDAGTSLQTNPGTHLEPSSQPSDQHHLSSASNFSDEGIETNPHASIPLSSPRSTPTMARRSAMKGTTEGETEAVKARLDIIGDDENSESSYSPNMKVCLCPPDPELPGFKKDKITTYELLHYPKELARQITLIDHELFQAVTPADLIKKVSEKKMPPSIDKVVRRFNQMSVWVVDSMLKEQEVQIRAKMFGYFIETAQECFALSNYSAIMAIIVHGLCGVQIKRLISTRELVDKNLIQQLAFLETLMDHVSNYKKYREALRGSPTPAVPYFGLYSKDLTFIVDGNPDYLIGGLVNLTKRRQIYAVIGEMKHFQKKPYNFQEVTEIREFLLSRDQYNDDELLETSKRLDNLSRQLEPGRPKSHSHSSASVHGHHSSSRRSTLPSFRSQSLGRTSGKRHHSSTKVQSS